MVPVLFSDASGSGLHPLRANLRLCLRLLGIRAALAIGAGMMVNRADTRARIRRLINVENGLTDEIATPFVLVAIAGAATAEHAVSTGSGVAVAELALGLLIGAAVGGGGGWLVKMARGRGWVAEGLAVSNRAFDGGLGVKGRS